MADPKFNPGDVVALKSGSPKMTVEWSNEEGRTGCWWYNYQTYHFEEKEFTSAMLQIVIPATGLSSNFPDTN
jgi:uncharacterized protein YodC (DUF2158 family)